MTYPKNLKGKVALIVGGAGAIGTATARSLAALGASVAITHRPGEENALRAKAIIEALQGRDVHAAFAADVADTPSLVALREQIIKRYGRLDILVNAAGFTRPIAHADLDGLDDDLIDRMFQVNWRGQFAAVRTFAPLLKETGDGLIVFISSIAGSTGTGSNIAYCAAKAGTDIMTKSLARALAPAVRVLAVSPGVVDTTFVSGRGGDFNAKTAAATPLKRIGDVEDVAAAIAACATHLGYSTGHTILVDGGRSL